MKRVLWVNPSFLDYRIPLYDELNKILSGNFYFCYNAADVPERCKHKLHNALHNNAQPLNLKKLHLKKNSDFANSGLVIGIPKHFFRTIRKIHPDIIITEGYGKYTPFAILYSIFNRIPIYLTYERTAHTERNCPKWRILYRKFINLFISGFLVNGSLTKEYLISQHVRPDKIFCGSMCADSKELSIKTQSTTAAEKTLLYGKLNIPVQKNGLIYIYVGQMIDRKGVDLLISSWKHHHDTYPDDFLLLVGDGNRMESLKKLGGNDSNIIFTGAIDYDNIHRYYAIADAFVIPTLEDNWSLVVPEAMACRLPVACSIFNGCHPDLIHIGKNGITFDPTDNNSTIKALEYFHSIDLHQHGINSQIIESRYSPSEVAKNISQAIMSQHS